MRTADELKQAVDGYMEAHGMQMKKNYFNPFEKTYQVTTMDYTEIDAKIVQCKNGKTKIVFKVDGKVVSIKK